MTVRRTNGFETDTTIVQAEGITFSGTITVDSGVRHRNSGGFGGSKSIKCAGTNPSVRIPAANVADAEEIAFAVRTGALGNWYCDFFIAGASNCAVKNIGDGYVRIYRSTTLLATSLSTLAADTWYWVLIKVTAKEAASSGQIQVYVNGVLVADTGAGVDCRAQTTDHFDVVRLGVDGGGGVAVYFDDYHQASTGTLSVLPALFILPITPTSDSSISSTSSGGGAGTYANVDEDPVSTADYNEWTATGIDRYGCSNLSTAPGEVLCVRVLADMTGEGTITTGRTVVHRAGSTGSGTYQGLSTGGTYSVVWDIHELDPSTGVAWDGTGVDAMEIGVQVA